MVLNYDTFEDYFKKHFDDFLDKEIKNEKDYYYCVRDYEHIGVEIKNKKTSYYEIGITNIVDYIDSDENEQYDIIAERFYDYCLENGVKDDGYLMEIIYNHIVSICDIYCYIE